MREKPFSFSDSLYNSAENNYNNGLYEQAAIDMDLVCDKQNLKLISY